ncbi:Protein CBR-GRL-10 [Caenorhabditis briggsae]|uniref:Ground-like domain-containing protein n=2 Tax=Caenorhabditis briggsae TaxID=6238 RepID=A0AAE9F137_CAEBR|nr:Protein CBR-GRL-10 [Caenorhabditis briggsae]ULT86669.1 hypothetical protein L3Y34_006403 [Caenorhabditis briggsae]UMM32421.1 hypothetical protein L5515_006218 [Caenorhabditis briggsae]CAP37569.1 Protein CBR-GRL-10 [Caenorhabditis briggsae]
MRHSVTLFILLTSSSVNGFFFGAAGGGGACGCSQPPACPPPPPPCGAHRAVARGAKTRSFDQPITAGYQPNYATNPGPQVYTVPDELDLRAAAFGVPIQPQPQYSIFDVLHNLGESRDSPAQQLVVADGSTNTDYFPKENDEDLTVSEMTGSGGWYRAKEIRRAPAEPTVHVHRDGSVESTTLGSVATEESFDKNKCSSAVLRKLMLEEITDSSAESKRNINVAAEGKFGGNVDVICSRGHFSYIFTSNLYCEVSKGLTTCIAFRQSDKVRRRK